MRALVELRGGLGNQLFQLCAALQAAEYGFEPVLDPSPLNFDAQRDLEVRDLSQTLGIRIGAEQGRWWRRAVKGRQTFIADPAGEFGDVAELLRGVSTPVVMRGYFQNRRNVEPHLDRLRGVLYGPSARLDDDGNVDDFICVHIRRGDYVSNATTREFHGNLGMDYYSRAIQACIELSGRRKVLLYSDDIEHVSEVMAPRLAEAIPEGTFVVRDYPYPSPLQEMAWLARHSFHVIANSTFSWWVASLSRGSHVVGPLQWWTASSAPSADGLRWARWVWV